MSRDHSSSLEEVHRGNTDLKEAITELDKKRVQAHAVKAEPKASTAKSGGQGCSPGERLSRQPLLLLASSSHLLITLEELLPPHIFAPQTGHSGEGAGGVEVWLPYLSVSQNHGMGWKDLEDLPSSSPKPLSLQALAKSPFLAFSQPPSGTEDQQKVSPSGTDQPLCWELELSSRYREEQGVCSKGSDKL